MPTQIKQKQYAIAGLIISALVIVITMVLMIDEKRARKEVKGNKTEKRIEISKVASGAKAEDRWLLQAENELKGLSQKVDTHATEKSLLEAKVLELEDALKRQEEKDELSTIDSLAAEIGRLREEMELLRASRASVHNNYDATLAEISSQQNEILALRKIRNYDLGLVGENHDRVMQTHNLNHYIPAGSYAPAVVISGVDASVGVNSQGEPRPILLRVTGAARSALADGQLQMANIVGCTVTGAASGDLSSERVFIRLLKMTCSRKENKVFETQVHGYVAGIGKAGIRGEVVSREGDFVFKSFLAGIASTAGSGLSQKFTTPMALSSGLATQRPETSDIISSSIGGGISNSSNRLSDYLIQRAEQYQPVISVPAGIDVELVFNDGFYLDGKGGINDQTTTN
jgi:hypothetical protein